MAVNRATGKDLLTVSGSYDLDHLDYVFTNPDRVFRVSHFFIDHWLPLLGPAQAWLVVAMQQACWRNGTRQPNGQISQRQLGQLCGLKRETVNRHLNNPESLVNWFISAIDPVHDSNGGRISNRYHVYLNDPLPPRLVVGLKILLRNHLVETKSTTSVKAIERLVQGLLDLDQTALLNLLEERAAHEPVPAQPSTVRALFYEYLNLDPQQTNRRVISLATNLSRHILQPDHVYIGTQYFREQWVPLLDATSAWLVTVVRRHCYENKSQAERRDAFTFDKQTLAAGLGISTKTLQRTLARPEALQPFFRTLTISHHTLTGHIIVNDEPLTPQDLAKKDQVEQQISQSTREAPGPRMTLVKSRFETTQPTNTSEEPSGQNVTGVEETSGQIVTGGPNESGQNVTGINGQIITGAEIPKKTKDHRGRFLNRQNVTGIETPKRQNITRDSPQSGQNITDSKHFLNSTQQDSAPSTSVVDDTSNQIEQTILQHLNQLGIRPPTRDELARLSHLREEGYLERWGRWFTAQNRFGTGWVVQQLRAGLLPPDDPPGDALSDILSPDFNQRVAEISPEARLWRETLTVLQHRMTRGTFESWLKDSYFISQSAQGLVIGVKNDQARAWLAHRLKEVIERAVEQVWGQALTVEFQVQ